MTADEIIEKAKNRYPLSISFRDRLSTKLIRRLEKDCTVHCPSVYIDGSAEYVVRWRKKKHEKA